MSRAWPALLHALGAASRRRRRTWPLAAATALAAFACAAALLLTSAVRLESLRALDLAPDLTVRRTRGEFHRPVTERDARALRAVPGVLRVTPRVWGYVQMQGAATLLTVVARRDDADLEGLLRGGPLPSPTARGWAALGADLARTFDLAPGDALSLHGVSLRVVAVFDPRTSLRTADVVLCAPDDARAVLGLAPGESTDLGVDLRSPDVRGHAQEGLYALIPDASVSSREDSRRAVTLTWGRRGGVSLLLLLPALLTLIVLALSSAGAANEAARREVATLRALGWSVAEVLRVEVMASLVPTSAATALGVVCAYGYVFPIGAPGLRDILLGPSAEIAFGRLAPATGAADLFILTSLVLAPQTLAATFSAWRAAAADPWDVLRL